MNPQSHSKTTIPVPFLVSESRTLAGWCLPDRGKLTGAGLDWALVEKLPLLADRCEELYVMYTVERWDLSECRKRMARRFKAASRVRSLTARKIRHALSVAGSENKLPSYHRREKPPEIIQDLFNLSYMCFRLKEYMENIGFNLRRASAIEKLARMRSDELAFFEGEKLVQFAELKKELQHSYGELHRVVNRIRGCAFEVFGVGHPRRKGYVSRYRSALNSRRMRKKNREDSPQM